MHNEFFIDTELGCIKPSEVGVETTNRTWVHQPNLTGGGDSFTQKTIDADTVAKTQKLLDRASA